MTASILTTIYRSDSKPGLYIYMGEDKEIDDLPNELQKLLGKYTPVMELDLNTKSKLANEDIQTVKDNLKAQGYHVQLPQDYVKSVLKYGQ